MFFPTHDWGKSKARLLSLALLISSRHFGWFIGVGFALKISLVRAPSPSKHIRRCRRSHATTVGFVTRAFFCCCFGVPQIDPTHTHSHTRQLALRVQRPSHPLADCRYPRIGNVLYNSGIKDIIHSSERIATFHYRNERKNVCV